MRWGDCGDDHKADKVGASCDFPVELSLTVTSGTWQHVLTAQGSPSLSCSSAVALPTTSLLLLFLFRFPCSPCLSFLFPLALFLHSVHPFPVSLGFSYTYPIFPPPLLSLHSFFFNVFIHFFKKYILVPPQCKIACKSWGWGDKSGTSVPSDC